MATTDPVEDISEPSGDEARNGRMAYWISFDVSENALRIHRYVLLTHVAGVYAPWFTLRYTVKGMSRVGITSAVEDAERRKRRTARVAGGVSGRGSGAAVLGPGRKKKVPLPDGTTVEATIVPFRGDVEHWNEYLLDDGTVVRMKAVVTEVLRIDGRYDREGNPAYAVNSTNVTHISAPEHLKKGGE
jgi:hypothetical protein